MGRWLLCLCLCLLPLASPAAELAPLADEGSLLLRAEQDRELCRELAAGEVLHYRFDASAALVFTAHFHRGEEGRSLWRRDEVRHEEGELTATLAARYCLTWFNYQEDALTLRWQVSRHR
ncbi:MAG: hypothetical protein KGI67_11090 [Pseudomonadota bacterium]|nr:hypothetical protein [Pseudomonadota bacterium]